MAELTLSASDIATALKKNLDGFEPSFLTSSVAYPETSHGDRVPERAATRQQAPPTRTLPMSATARQRRLRRPRLLKGGS